MQYTHPSKSFQGKFLFQNRNGGDESNIFLASCMLEKIMVL
jgi:hypothetical protein